MEDADFCPIKKETRVRTFILYHRKVKDNMEKTLEMRVEELERKPQGKMLYFEKSELEAWLRQNPVKTKMQIEQEAQKYVLNRPLKK